MDVSEQDDGLFKTLFQESFQDAWKDNPDFSLYLAELSASSVEKLSREPEKLAEEKAQILEQTEHLAFNNYKTFIKTAECSKEIFNDFVSVEEHVESLLDKLPTFSETCSNFMKVAQEINTSRHLNSLTLARHTQLLEILEISQLMDSCVRNGYYEEALELSSYVQRLEKKLSNIPIIQNIVDVVQSSTQLMLSQLLQQLRSAIQLPACLRVIGYLRRLDLFSESELRIKFLQARDTWLQSVLASISSDDPYYHITKTIETSRVHLFDIVTQYRAIFSDDDPILSMENEDSPIYGNLFHCWIVQKVQQFLNTLENDLEQGVGNRLDSLLGQCMYFGLSFSRVGADFRGLLPPLFHAAALKSFNTEVHNATDSFHKAMKSFSPQPVPSTVTSTIISTMATKPDELNPPIELLQHPPLAAFINSILSAFNNLRHCAPISLASPVTDSVCSALKTVIQSTCAFHRTEATALNETERASFANFCQVLGKQVMPYMKECLEAFFPSSVLTNLYGGSFLDVRLDVDALLVLLEPVMPQDSTQEEDKPPHQKNEAKNSEYDRRKDQENSESNESRLSKVEPNKDVNEELPDSVQRTQDLTQVEAVSR
ncbi:conserved oligomeric Golgi complex subunit 8-like [Pocillopora verrucosa]|uniref:conserved oligomeric Golgi complex subunit 8-like n=1 Tax=Pocillopora verrucosa TaxID=203993 RepID=UPI00333EE9FF